MRTFILSVIASALFAVAAVISFINGNSFRAVIGLVGAVSFLLAGLHWRKNKK